MCRRAPSSSMAEESSLQSCSHASRSAGDLHSAVRDSSRSNKGAIAGQSPSATAGGTKRRGTNGGRSPNGSAIMIVGQASSLSPGFQPQFLLRVRFSSAGRMPAVTGWKPVPLFRRQGRFDGVSDFLAVRSGLAIPAFENLSIAADEELAEIPFYVAGERGVLAGERGVERVLLGALDVEL